VVALGVAGWCGVVAVLALARSGGGPSWREEEYLAVWRGAAFYRYL
jgi:hypothetical protein